MFRFSFASIPEKEEKPDEFPLVAALNFGKLDVETPITQKPIVCKFCESVLSNKSALKVTKGDYIFECPFCLHETPVSKLDGNAYLGVIGGSTSDTAAADVISMAGLAFLLDQIKEDKDKTLKEMEMGKGKSGFSLQVAIIDVSGSMGGGKIEAVKHALVQNIHQLTADAPQTQFLLIPFTTGITIYPDPANKIDIQDGPIMFKESDLEKEAQKIISKYQVPVLEKTYADWTTIVKALYSQSSTALGPALFMGVMLAIAKDKGNSKKVGGKIMLLTDGLANVGLGSIENSREPDSPEVAFYNRVAQKCIDNKLLVDIVAVRDDGGGNAVALNIIGKVTDYTGGQMLFITADQIEKAFGDLNRTNYVAKNVVLRVFLPEILAIEEIQGADLLQALPDKSGEAIKLGAFYPDREIYIKFKQTKPSKGKIKVPVQIKLEYEDAQNLRRVRLIQREIDISKNADDFKKNFDAGVATAYELSKASKAKSKGDFKFAQVQAEMTITRNTALQKNYGQSVDNFNALVNDEKDEWATEEKEVEEQKVADKSSYYAAKGQSRSRSSMDSKMKRMMSKK